MAFLQVLLREPKMNNNGRWITTMTMTTKTMARIDHCLEERKQKRRVVAQSQASPSFSSKQRVSWVAGRGSISDTPDRFLCRRGPVFSLFPYSRRSHPEIISIALLSLRTSFASLRNVSDDSQIFSIGRLKNTFDKNITIELIRYLYLLRNEKKFSIYFAQQIIIINKSTCLFF